MVHCGAEDDGPQLTRELLPNLQLHLQEQSEGMYILIVQDGANVYKTRIIKKR